MISERKTRNSCHYRKAAIDSVDMARAIAMRVLVYGVVYGANDISSDRHFGRARQVVRKESRLGLGLMAVSRLSRCLA